MRAPFWVQLLFIVLKVMTLFIRHVYSMVFVVSVSLQNRLANVIAVFVSHVCIL